MFLLLTLTASTDKFASDNNISRNRVIQDLMCTETIPISSKITSVILSSGIKVCVESNGTIFVGGINILITGFVNGEQKKSGKGVAAVLGNSKYDKYVFTIESSKSQTVFISNSIIMRSYYHVYVTTRNKHGKINILNRCIESGYNCYGGYIMLGPKSNIQLKVSTENSTIANLTAPGYQRSTVIRGTEEKTFTGYENAFMIDAITRSESDGVYVELTSDGAPWPIEMDGFIIAQSNQIYEEGDFYVPLSNTAIWIIRITIVISVLLIPTTIISVICCVYKRVGRNGSIGTGETAGVTTRITTENNESPPNDAPEHNTGETTGVTTQYANSTQPPLYESLSEYNQTPNSPYTSPPMYNQTPDSVKQPVYPNPYSDTKPSN